MLFHPVRPGAIAVCLLVLSLSGCIGTSQPSRFYTLNSLRSPEPVPHLTSTGQGTIVAIGPVLIPDYLDRPEIVTRTGQNEMRVNDFQRWAGNLQGNLLRVLIEDLSVILPADRLSVIRWVPTAQRDVPITYRVMVDIMRFDAAPGGTVQLEADWTVFAREKDIVFARRSSVSAKINGNEFTDMVASMSKAVEDLCREIAAGVTSLEQRSPGKALPQSDRTPASP